MAKVTTVYDIWHVATTIITQHVTMNEPRTLRYVDFHENYRRQLSVFDAHSFINIQSQSDEYTTWC